MSCQLCLVALLARIHWNRAEHFIPNEFHHQLQASAPSDLPRLHCVWGGAGKTYSPISSILAYYTSSSSPMPTQLCQPSLLGRAILAIFSVRPNLLHGWLSCSSSGYALMRASEHGTNAYVHEWCIEWRRRSTTSFSKSGPRLIHLKSSRWRLK